VDQRALLHALFSAKIVLISSCYTPVLLLFSLLFFDTLFPRETARSSLKNLLISPIKQVSHFRNRQSAADFIQTIHLQLAQPFSGGRA
jgi:hypothetical protein